MAKPTQSFLNMAEAMLQEEYKTSHTNLKEWGDENEMEEAAKQYQQREESEENAPGGAERCAAPEGTNRTGALNDPQDHC